MENVSKMIDDSSSSMYFSFNSTTAYKTVENPNEISLMALDGDDEGEQNMTLEAEENLALEQVQTVKKLSFGVSPVKAIPKNILKAYKALSSTPTKAQLLRSVEVHRGSAAVVDVCDLGLAFLEAPQEAINTALSEDKENQPQESLDIVYSETSSEIVVSVIEKTPEEEKPVSKKVGFSNLPVLKSSVNSNIRGTPRVRRSISKCEPDLATNRPSRIIPKRVATAKGSSQEFSEDEVPKMLNSILKISKGLPCINRKSNSNLENPFNLLGKATRMSIVKTTLNSPARRVSRKSLTLAPPGRNPMRQSVLPTYKRMSFVSGVATSAAASSFRRSVIPSNSRKSMLPTGATSPKKRIAALNSQKSMIPTTSSLNPASRKSIASTTSTSASVEISNTHIKQSIKLKPPTNLKEEFVCEVCSRKFRVSSLFEAHKRSHNNSATSTKQTFSAGNDKQCRYCDKKFAIAKALTNHLIQNCTKIPPGDKKKLLFPTEQATSNVQLKAKLPPKSMSTLSSCDSLSSNSTQVSRSQLNAKHSDSSDSAMLPPSICKLKKKTAHSGVYCTPNKQILCHICKTSFNNILAFTEHKLSHSNDDGATTDSRQKQVDLKSDDIQTENLQNDVVLI